MEKLFSLLLPHRRPPAWWHQNPPLESPGFLRSAADWPTDWTRLPCPSASGRSYSWRGWYSSGSLCRGWWAWLAWCWCTAWPSSPQMSRNLKVECVLFRIVKISLTIIKKKAVLFLLIIIIIIISFGAVFCLPILKSEVIFCISAMRSVPRFLTFSKSSFMEKERSIR